MKRRRSVDVKGSREARNVRPKKKKAPQTNESMESETSYASTSAKKLHEKQDISFDPNFSYCILQFTAVFSAISDCVVCKECGGKVKFLQSSVRGLGFKLNIKCTTCDKDINSISSSPLIGSAYEINRRLAFTMRVLGKGLRGIQFFCGLMDLPKYVTKKPFNMIVENIHNATKAVGMESLKKAAGNEIQLNNEAAHPNIPDGLKVSGDGTWMKRGFSSLFGVVTIIGWYTGKVLDIIVKSSYCKACETYEKEKGSAKYEEWLKNHIEMCSANHIGSAGKMESDGIIEIFQRSLKLYNVVYAYYIGDGDSKTFSAILKASIYDNIIPKKLECVGHVQKRMGTRLRNVKKTYKEAAKVTKSKSQSLEGKGKLTASLIDELTVYYGLAIRNNSDSVKNMKDAIWATFYHKISTDAKPQHIYCPTGTDSWCTWQKANAVGNLKNYVHKPALPDIVQTAIKPVYEALSNEELLQRCLGGFTQNNNESLNQKIWKIAPKSTFGSFRIIEIAAYVAASTFNDGADSYLRILDVLGIQVGRNAYDYCQAEDTSRLMHARIKAQQETKEARTARRQSKTKLHMEYDAQEGTSYGPGIAE